MKIETNVKIEYMKAINETIANAIVDNIEGGNGTFSIEVEVNGTTVYADGSFEIDGYQEDDYFNGTGAWGTTYVAVSVESVEAYDEDGEAVEIDCSLNEIERYAEMGLAA